MPNTRRTDDGLPWKTRSEIPDVQVSGVAEQFDDARLLLLSRDREAGLLFPLISNATIALELYLKSLSAREVHTASPILAGITLVTAASTSQIHNLIPLLEAIPSDVRRSVEEAYRLQHDGRLFRGDLSECEGLFQASRYPFENKNQRKMQSCPIDLLMSLCAFLRSFTQEMEPVDRILWKSQT